MIQKVLVSYDLNTITKKSLWSRKVTGANLKKHLPILLKTLRLDQLRCLQEFLTKGDRTPDRINMYTFSLYRCSLSFTSCEKGNPMPVCPFLSPPGMRAHPKKVQLCLGRARPPPLPCNPCHLPRTSPCASSSHRGSAIRRHPSLSRLRSQTHPSPPAPDRPSHTCRQTHLWKLLHLLWVRGGISRLVISKDKFWEK